MEFDELIKHAHEYYERNFPMTPEWLKRQSESGNVEESDRKRKADHFNDSTCNGCDIVNAFNAGYWLARDEMGLPKCD